MSETVANKSIFSLTWPIFVDMALHVLTGSINIFMVGQISSLAVASMAFGNELLAIGIIIFNFIGIGTCVAIAQMLGAKETRNIKKVVHNAFGFNIISCFFIILLLFNFSDQLLNLLQVGPEIYDDSRDYLLILSLCLIPESLGLCCASVIRAYGYTREAMLSSLLANIVTIFGNAFLLFGWFGLPKYGLCGAATSFVLGRIVLFLVIFKYMIKMTKIKVRPSLFFSFKSNILKRILRIGLPAAGENLAWNLQFITATAFVASIGSYELAAHTFYFNTITFYLMIFAISIGMATEIKVAFYVGSGAYDKAYERLIKSLKIGIIGAFVVSLCMSFGPSNLLINIFTNGEESVISLVGPLIIFSIFMEPGRAFNTIVINSLRAANDANFPMIMAIISMWCIAVPLEYILGIKCGYGLLGIWIAFGVDEWFRGLSMYIRWRSKVWQKKSKQLKLT